jgi:hypothetical protein
MWQYVRLCYPLWSLSLNFFVFRHFYRAFMSFCLNGRYSWCFLLYFLFFFAPGDECAVHVLFIGMNTSEFACMYAFKDTEDGCQTISRHGRFQVWVGAHACVSLFCIYTYTYICIYRHAYILADIYVCVCVCVDGKVWLILETFATRPMCARFQTKKAPAVQIKARAHKPCKILVSTHQCTRTQALQNLGFYSSKHAHTSPAKFGFYSQKLVSARMAAILCSVVKSQHWHARVHTHVCGKWSAHQQVVRAPTPLASG